MSHVLFDCTQFVTFQTKEHKKIESLKGNFENLGFMVYEDTEIQERKRAYFEDYFKGTVLELFDQEFLGDFEDWKEVSQPTIKLEGLIRIIEELAKDEAIKGLKVMIVNCASEDQEEDGILQLATSADTAANDLFSMSYWNFDVKSDVVILNFD